MLQNTTIERRTCVRDLGMYIDEKLKWRSHIAHVVLNISRNLGIRYGKSKIFAFIKGIAITLQHIGIASLILLRGALGEIIMIQISKELLCFRNVLLEL